MSRRTVDNSSLSERWQCYRIPVGANAAGAIDVLCGTLDLLVLKTIALEPMHGWGITQGIASSSRGVLEVNQGSLYLALQRLEQRRAITAEWQTTDNNRRAKYYRLTPKGRLELADETEAWRRYALAVAWVLRTT